MQPPSSNPLTSTLLAQVIDLAEDAIISIGADQRIALFNQGAERIFGYPAQEAIGQPLDILLPERAAAQHRVQVSDFSKSGLTARRKSERNLISGRKKSGQEFPAEASISRVEAGDQTLLTVILRDITPRVEADRQLRDALDEKDSLLREIHHRVKNNLQVMSSLLGLQARNVPGEEARQAFEDSQGRIHAMSLIHELLCRTPDLSRVDIADYTSHLAAYRFRAQGPVGQRIRLETDFDPVYLDLDRAVPYGLIANELLTNALRHAFPGGRKGEIRLSLRALTEQSIRLTVQDDGSGFPEALDWQNAPTLGLRLVRMLAEQLKAAVDVRPKDPTSIQLTFATR